MAQLLHTGKFGTIEVEKSWVYEQTHICKLTKGGYVYVSGLPVASENDLKRVIPAGPDRDEALVWFYQKDQADMAPRKRIIINPDGSCSFEDGSPVENVSDILTYIPPGPFQDAAYKWLQEKTEKDKRMRELAAKSTGRAAVAVKRGFGGRFVGRPKGTSVPEDGGEIKTTGDSPELQTLNNES